jgi:ribonucleoside-diphosphate reductase alpha chain
VECAWGSGEPGVIFLDQINKDNPTPLLGRIESTNPCGEQPLLPYEACNLGSINLVQMITEGVKGPAIDWDKLRRTVRLAVRFLDNVIEVNHYPLPQIEQVSRGNRKIGLGVMGFAHFLILMGVSYDSDDGVRLGEEVMKCIQEVGHEASLELAELRGPFPNFTGSRYDLEGKPPLRNATVTTIAPTGTLSIIADCSSGIEPLFALSYTRKALEDEEFFEIDPIFVRLGKEMGFWRPELEDTLRQTGFVGPAADIPPRMRKLFATAFEISPARHIKMQAAFQRHTDNAVSKTINFPPDASTADVQEAFLLAYRMGCKGVTIYRSGTRMGQVLTCGLNQLC